MPFFGITGAILSKLFIHIGVCVCDAVSIFCNGMYTCFVVFFPKKKSISHSILFDYEIAVHT